MAKSTKQIQEEITSKIVESLKAGSIPWRKPWSTSPKCGTPANVVSGKAYCRMGAQHSTQFRRNCECDQKVMHGQQALDLLA